MREGPYGHGTPPFDCVKHSAQSIIRWIPAVTALIIPLSNTPIRVLTLSNDLVGMGALTTPSPVIFAFRISAGPRRRPRSEGLIGAASMRTITSSASGTGKGTVAIESSSSPCKKKRRYIANSPRFHAMRDAIRWPALSIGVGASIRQVRHWAD